MKHIFTTLLLLATLPLMAQTQDCKIPVSYKVEVEPHSIANEAEITAPFVRFLKSQGFTTDMSNTRLAITLVPKLYSQESEDASVRMELEIRLTDIYTKDILYSWQLDTSFSGHYTFLRTYSSRPNQIKYTNVVTWHSCDFSVNSPVCNKIVESIRNITIKIFEANTHNITRIAQDCAKKGNHETALFTLVQYPECCSGYTNITNSMLSVYRDYTKKDHTFLLDEANRIWKNTASEAEARFIVSLLNSETLNADEQSMADRLLRKVAKAFPSVDIKGHEDYTSVKELKAVALLRARTIGIDRSYYEEIPSTENPIPEK